ncbi:MAG: peptide-methionine (S)-S-oxide reductase MsrA [Pirellulaceae bacterium]
MLNSLNKPSGRRLLALGIALGLVAGYGFHVLRGRVGHGEQLDAAAAFPTLDEAKDVAKDYAPSEAADKAADEPAPGDDAQPARDEEPASSGDSLNERSSRDVQPEQADGAADSAADGVIAGDVIGDDTGDGDRPQASQGPASQEPASPPKLAVATFGSGCFWCSEAYFESLKGVVKVEAGYSGGRVENPTYDQVCSGTTGHAEVAQITYNPEVVSYAKLLEVFWRTHDPTTLNRQGSDVGEQYRSVVFYHDDQQRAQAEKYRKKLDEAEVFRDPIVTQIAPFKKFYVAGDDHQDYYAKNATRMYCRFHIAPTLSKMRAVFGDAMKPPR